MPNILKLFNNAKKEAFVTEAKKIYGSVSDKYISENLKGNKLTYISSEDNTKLDLTGGKNIKYCIKLNNAGKVKSMKIGNDNYYILFNGKDISKLTINDIHEEKYTQDTCNESAVLIKPKKCIFDGELTQGAEYVDGQYTYRYMQEGSSEWNDIDIDGWGIMLTDKESTNPVTSEICTSINNKPIVSAACMFYESKASSIDLSSFDSSNVTNMSVMFGSTAATKVILDNLDTSNVTNMASMFFNSNFNELDLSNFDTSNVTNMQSLFLNSKATSINLSNWNTSKVTTMDIMFEDSLVESLDLSSFDTSNVTSMVAMFYATKIKSLDLSNFNTSKVTNMLSMFAKSDVEKINLTSFDTSKVTNMSAMFRWSGLSNELDLSSFDTSKAKYTDYMFMDTGIEKVYVRSKADADKFNKATYKPEGIQFIIK